MIYYKLKLKSMPKIEFAHYFTMPNYSFNFMGDRPQIELVYIKNGGVSIETLNKNYYIPEGSFFIFCRAHKLKLTADKDISHVHYTCSLTVDYDCKVTNNPLDIVDDSDDMVSVPLFIEPSDGLYPFTERLKQIISEFNSVKNSSHICSLSALGLLSDLSLLCKKNIFKDKRRIMNPSILSYKTKKYISANIESDLSLKKIANELNKSPNYLNSVFKAVNNITIGRYINKEKVNMIIELRRSKNISFAKACHCVGIHDSLYGYRLFKKFTGLTPDEYLNQLFIHKNTFTG